MVSYILCSILLLMDLTEVFWHVMSLQLDCGIHPGLEGMDALPYIDLIDPAEIDLLLISQWVPFSNERYHWYLTICWPSSFSLPVFIWIIAEPCHGFYKRQVSKGGLLWPMPPKPFTAGCSQTMWKSGTPKLLFKKKDTFYIFFIF